MSLTSSREEKITSKQLADRLAAGEQMTILDIRPDADWMIEAPGVRHVHAPADQLLADPSRLDGLDGAVAVVCNRGLTAAPVAEALRARGVDAAVVDGGMRGWIGTLQDRPVDAGLDGAALHQVQRPGRGCLSYVLISDGEALVVDPAPDVEHYVALAAESGARVTDIVDTHIHADHLSGARVLAQRTGATLRLPAPALERGVEYADAVEPLADGDEFTVGSVTVRAVGLPGHTTDMTGLLLGGRALVSGDSLFADGIARPDLQRGDHDGARAMARQLHRTLRDRVLALDPGVVLLPGHTHPGVNAGAIAPELAEVREQVPELSIDDPDDFAEALLEAMPPRPANYEAVIAVNSGRHPFDPELETGGNSCSTR
ncbi:MAG: MBL fold metallo-hydrolase [Solirubrobacterales bacterium]